MEHIPRARHWANDSITWSHLAFAQTLFGIRIYWAHSAVLSLDSLAKVLGACEEGLTCFVLLLVLLNLLAPQHTSELLHVTRMIQYVAPSRPCLGTVIPHLSLYVILRAADHPAPSRRGSGRESTPFIYKYTWTIIGRVGGGNTNAGLFAPPRILVSH